MDLSKLSVLKEMMMTAESFSDPWDYFFDHFGENPRFIDLGKRVKSPLIKAVLDKVGKHLLGKDAKVTRIMLEKIKRHHFIHGTCHIDGRLAVVIYFTDVDMGLLSIVSSPMGLGDTLLIRFTSYHIEPREGEGEATLVVPQTRRTVN